MSWDNARRHARALETALDAKLASYSRIASAIARGPGGSSTDDGPGGYKLVEEEIEELLAKLEQAIDDLTTLINSPSQPPSTSMQHAAQRHRDNLDDYRRDFLRARNNVDQAIQRTNLLGSVRKEIRADLSEFKSSQTDALLQDRGRIDSSHRMLDETLDQAYATREDFAQQRSALRSIESRMGGVLSQMPGINSLITMIRSRRRRDSIIVGCVVAFCVLLILGYLFGF
ncbi:snare region anchored in the vesicle membrane C-terminus-domain-containing protein [Papiliotrema laurentii]|uniref:Golgi SNAP receptor complex member 1 n=1 Tax=Papiliotrema laurentii TaxID=5418 RepID=A0AAD9CZF7_PAPLA|nr:snare region anchored in the vesicle membrane C-terminus-domain-containing protein [Papiliotrema laurentii]